MPTEGDSPKENEGTERLTGKEVREDENEETPTEQKSDQPDKAISSSEDGDSPYSSQSPGDDDKKSTFTREARNRVKLYVLAEQRTWEDKGTGHVACLPLDEQPGFHCIIVRLEANEKNVLESKILMDTVYQKQQETLIVWSESETCDLALSFQEKSGCEEIWTRICQVQGKDPKDAEGGVDDLDESDLHDGASGSSGGASGGSGGSGGGAKAYATLPPAEMGRLNEIEMVLANHMNTAMQRERIASSIENSKLAYVGKLCEIFRMCEDVENTEGLHSLYNICKRLFMLNRTGVIEMMVAEESLKEVIGMLEYDPSQLSPRPHREFLYEKAKFRQILPMNNPQLKEKIHQTYRLQYLQDVCLPAPSLFEENLLSALASHIFFTRLDIVMMLQEDKALLRELFSQLKDASTSVSRRRELSLFLKELCAMSQSLQQNGPQSKEVFYKTLVQNDVLAAVEECMRSPDADTRATTTDMLHMVVVFSAQTVRDYLLRQAKEKRASDKEVLMNVLLSHIVTDRDSELSSATQMLQVMRMLLDPDNMTAAQKGDKSEFLQFFYHRCIPTLVSTLNENVASGVPGKDDYHTAKKQSLVLRLINFCVTHHAYLMRKYVVENDFLNRMLVLLKSRHHFLALYALKLLRSVVQQKEAEYVRHMVEKKVLDAVVDCFLSNGTRNNLLNSAIIELFEYIFSEDLKALMAYVVETHDEVLSTHSYVKTFAKLRTKHEQHKEREKDVMKGGTEGEGDKKGASPSAFSQAAQRQWSREKEVEKEEVWFDHEDEEEEGELGKEKEKNAGEATPPSGVGRKTGQEPMFSKFTREPSLDDDENFFLGGSNPPPVLAPKSTKIVIKVDGVRSRSASPGAVREDEVTSSQASSTAATAPILIGPTLLKKGLVEYDDSDSDDEEAEDKAVTDLLSSPSPSGSCSDSLPSSSTGSPTREEEEKRPVSARGENEESNDVSSTSQDGQSHLRGDDPCTAVSSPPPPSPSLTEEETRVRSGRRKRREEAAEEETAESEMTVKRARQETASPSSPPPIHPVAQ